jgi:hypothetical protein
MTLLISLALALYIALALYVAHLLRTAPQEKTDRSDRVVVFGAPTE